MAAIRAWYRLDRAFAAIAKHLRSAYGVTGEQVAICRIVAERGSWPLSELRDRLTMHPATLGQALARLAEHGLVTSHPDGSDGRRRHISVTKAGRELLASIPLVGPVRLRTVDADPQDLAALAAAFTKAVDLFGLTQWADDPTTIGPNTIGPGTTNPSTPNPNTTNPSTPNPNTTNPNTTNPNTTNPKEKQ